MLRELFFMLIIGPQKNAPIQLVWPEKDFFYAFPFVPYQVSSFQQILEQLETENWPPVSISC